VPLRLLQIKIKRDKDRNKNKQANKKESTVITAACVV